MYITLESGKYVMQLRCPYVEDYWPCECPLQDKYNDVMLYCSKVPIEDIKDVFKSTTAADFKHIFLDPWNYWTVAIPEDIFVNHRVTDSIYVGYTEYRPINVPLQVHSDAFRSSRNSVKRFSIRAYDLTKLTFQFLSNFSQLTTFMIRESKNVDLSTLPSLPSLCELMVKDSSGPNEWTVFPKFVKALEIINLQGSYLTDESMERISKWIINILQHNSQKGYIKMNPITSQKKIKNIYFVKIYSIGVARVEIDLSNNYLSRLESSVFKELFEAIAAITNDGRISIDGSKLCMLYLL